VTLIYLEPFIIPCLLVKARCDSDIGGASAQGVRDGEVKSKPAYDFDELVDL
jgi:hypothetical protein